ncbi:MAG: MotA/TolQ/ExbB proton channel family protein [Ignavibacteria bacterium]|jgi:biopolymer transport protein ExbB/TolQ
MSALSSLESFLYVLSTVLFYPVIIGLILLTFWMLISLGNFAREYLDRRRNPDAFIESYKQQMETVVLSSGNNHVANTDLLLEKLLQEEEQKLYKSLKKISFVIRVGPSLGLMGTLIPMGVALSSLAQGDMPAMAGNMVTAFTTTIVGLATGVVAYLISLIKEKWINDDIRAMEYQSEITLREISNKNAADFTKPENELSVTATQ